MTLTIDLPDKLETLLRAHALAKGVSEAGLVQELLEEALGAQPDAEAKETPFETGYGMWAAYGPAPSAEEIDANRMEMFRGFGEGFE